MLEMVKRPNVCLYFFPSVLGHVIIIIIIMSLTPVSSLEKDIGGVPSMQSSYSAEMRRYGICMEERSVIVSA